jgi:hypothetical protein
MKIAPFLLGSIIMACYGEVPEGVTLALAPQWRVFQDTFSSKYSFTDQWILCATIVIKKKSQRIAQLKKITVGWHGSPINSLSACLYHHKYHHEQFYPIEDKFIADGQWDQKKQWLTFRFVHPPLLTLYTTYYLVLSVSPELIASLRDGSFYLDADNTRIAASHE